MCSQTNFIPLFHLTSFQKAGEVLVTTWCTLLLQFFFAFEFFSPFLITLHEKWIEVFLSARVFSVDTCNYVTIMTEFLAVDATYFIGYFCCTHRSVRMWKNIHCGSRENLLKYTFFIGSNMSDCVLFLMSSNKPSLPTIFYTLQRNKCIIRELKHQQRRQLRKRFLKWIRAASNFVALIPSCSIRQMWTNFSEVEF